MKIRKMRHEDVDPIYEIEKKLCPFPWSKKTISDCIDIGYGCFVMDVSKKVIGFGIASTFFDEAHILNIGITKEKHGKGYGFKMMEHLLNYIKQNEYVENIFLEVNVNNTKAISLYETFGFRKIGIRKDYYRVVNGREDAFVLVLEL